MSGPTSYELTAVQEWVCRKLKYSGQKEEMANAAVERALEWWVRNGDSTYAYSLQQDSIRSSAKARWKKAAYKECKTYIHDTPKRYGFIWSILLSLVLNIVISAVARIIVDWLFSEKSARTHYAVVATAYRESVAGDDQ